MRDPFDPEYLQQLRDITDPLLSSTPELIAATISDGERYEVRRAGLSGTVRPPTDTPPTDSPPVGEPPTVDAPAGRPPTAHRPKLDPQEWDRRARLIAAETDKLNSSGTDCIVPDGEKLVRAQQLFAHYGNEIAGALLLAGLPQTYAAEPGSAVLTATGRLQQDLRRRVRGTAQFLMVVMQQAPGRTETDRRKRAVDLWKQECVPAQRDGTPHDKTPPPWKMCATLRIYHDAVRQEVTKLADNDKKLKTRLRLDAKQPEQVLNQEDLLGTLLTFTIAVFEVLEQMGIRWSADDKDAYLHAWDVVGVHLGIGDSLVRKKVGRPLSQRLTWQGLRPLAVQDTEALLEQIRRRQWLELPDDLLAKDGNWTSARPGRLLVRALAEELALAMPARKRSWPLALMRYFSPEVVQERLLLGAPGVILGSMKHLSDHSIARASAISARGRPRVEARVIRMMSNEVTRRSMIHFIREGHIVIPGLEDWSDGFDLTDSFGRV